MFTSFFTPFNTTVFMRSWPFKILFLRWFMRGAGYIDTEKVSIETFLESEGRLLKERNVSFLFFPEGHRSATGKLQNFHSGAFHVATGLDIPIIPVSLTGTEKFVSMKDHFVRPATVEINILSPVRPTLFEGERRARKLKKHVEDLIREDLNEQA
jgi:1-acyl-sn-glycerol-3-phosphate acyltransferase